MILIKNEAKFSHLQSWHCEAQRLDAVVGETQTFGEFNTANIALILGKKTQSLMER